MLVRRVQLRSGRVLDFRSRTSTGLELIPLTHIFCIAKRTLVGYFDYSCAKRKNYKDNGKILIKFRGIHFTRKITKRNATRPQGYKRIFVPRSKEYEIYPAIKCKNANNTCQFNIYQHGKYRI